MYSRTLTLRLQLKTDWVLTCSAFFHCVNIQEPMIRILVSTRTINTTILRQLYPELVVFETFYKIFSSDYEHGGKWQNIRFLRYFETPPTSFLQLYFSIYCFTWVISHISTMQLSQSKSKSKVKSQNDLEWLYSDNLIQIKN